MSTQSADKIEEFFLKVYLGEEEISNVLSNGITATEMRNYLDSLPGQKASRNITTNAEVAYDIWRNTLFSEESEEISESAALDLIKESSEIYLQSGKTFSDFVPLVVEDELTKFSDEIYLPDLLTTGEVKEFAAQNGYLLAFTRSGNEVGDEITFGKLYKLGRPVQVEMIPLDKSVVSQDSDLSNNVGASKKDLNMRRTMLRELQGLGEVRLVKRENLNGQEINTFSFNDSRLLGGYLKRTRKPGDFYIFDFDDTLYSRVGDLRALGYIAPAPNADMHSLQGSKLLLHPGAETLLTLNPFVIITNRGQEYLEEIRTSMKENNAKPLAIIGTIKQKFERPTPKGVVMVELLSENEIVADNIRAIHFVDDDENNLINMKTELNRFYAKKGNKPTINLYLGTGAQIIAFLQGLSENEIIRNSNIALDQNAEIMRRTAPKVSAPAPKVSPSSEPPVPAKVSPSPRIALGSPADLPPRVPPREPAGLPALPPRVSARAPSAAPGLISSPPSRPISPPRVLSPRWRAEAAPLEEQATYSGRRAPDYRDYYYELNLTLPPVAAPRCVDRGKIGNVRVEFCKINDLRWMLAKIQESGPENLFVFDFDDTLVSKPYNFWSGGIVKVPGRDTYLDNNQKLFFLPGAEEILKLASRRTPQGSIGETPRIIILTQRNGEGIAEAERFLQKMGMKVEIYSVHHGRKVLSKGARLVTLLDDNPSWLARLQNIYFIDDTDTHCETVLREVPPYLKGIGGNVNLYAYEVKTLYATAGGIGPYSQYNSRMYDY